MKRLLLSLIIVGWVTVALSGQVNPEYGSYLESVTEFSIPSPGFNLDMTRTYSSMSTHSGLFVFGMGVGLEPCLSRVNSLKQKKKSS